MTVDQLDHLTHSRRTKNKAFSLMKEILIIGGFFVLAAAAVTVFTNAQLFMASFQDSIAIGTPATGADIKKTMTQDSSIFSIVDTQHAKDQEISNLITQYQSGENTPAPLARDTDVLLAEQLKGYDITFNTLPPTNRLLVPRFGVNDPIVISKYTNMEEFIYKNYNEELSKGVVKYPTTPSPGESGNALIFGHTSEERWKHNPYSMAFAHLAQINIGDTVQVIRNGKLIEYKVVDIQVKYPDHVNDTYMQYANLSKTNGKNYLTMMGCYPIGTAKQRMLVIAEQLP